MRVGNIFCDHISRDWKWLLCQRMCLSGGKILQVIEVFNLVQAPSNFLPPCRPIHFFDTSKSRRGKITSLYYLPHYRGTNQMEKVYNNPMATFYLFYTEVYLRIVFLPSLFCGINAKTKFLCSWKTTCINRLSEKSFRHQLPLWLDNVFCRRQMSQQTPVW